MEKTPKMTLVGNWNNAGTNRFVLHAVDEFRHMATVCGIRLEDPRYHNGDWQYEEGDYPGCLNCIRVMKAK